MNKLKSRILGLSAASAATVLLAVSIGHGEEPVASSTSATPSSSSSSSSSEPSAQDTMVASSQGVKAVEKADAKYPKVPVPKTFRPINNDCSGGYVYFTYDDGPNMYTGQLLDRLKALNVRGTFFVLGQNIWGREAVVRRALADGNRIENHTWDHTNLVTGKTPSGKQVKPWGEQQIRDEIDQTQIKVKEVTGTTPVTLRPPFGAHNATIDAIGISEGLAIDDPNRPGTINSNDYAGDSSAQIVKNVVGGLRDQGHGLAKNRVIVQHDGLTKETYNTIGAMQGIVDAMNKKHLCSSVDFRIADGKMVP